MNLFSRDSDKARWTTLAQQRSTVVGTCWLWTGATDNQGYARVKNGGRTDRLHHLICKETHQPSKGRAWVARHLCGAKACVNPDHIAPGSKLENKADDREHARTAALLPSMDAVAALAATLPAASPHLLRQADDDLREEQLRIRLAVDQSCRGGDDVASVVFKEWAGHLDHKDPDHRLLLVLAARKKREASGRAEPEDTGLRTSRPNSAPT